MQRCGLSVNALSSSSYQGRAPSSVNESVSQARSAFRLFREAKAAGSLRKPNPSAPYRATIELPLPVKQTLLNPFSADVRGERIRPLDQGDWPGGVVQQFRALRPLIDSLLEGYSTEFVGMLGAPEDGMGVWRSEGTTVVCNVVDLTFAQFAKLCCGEFGSSVLEPEHLVVVVNPGWTGSKGIGQFWDRKLKEQARELVDNAQWDEMYCCRAVRTAKDAHGLLVRAFPGPWCLYPRPADDADVAAASVLEAEQQPDAPAIAALLNEAQPAVQRQFAQFLKEREQSRKLF